MAGGDRDRHGAPGSSESSPGDERTRLIEAITRTAAERGYANTTADQVASYAGVPLETFYRHFPDTDQCLLAAYDRFFERLATHIEAACDDRDPWPVQVKAAIGAALCFFAEVSGAGRVFAVEGLSIGPAALERCFASIEGLAELLRGGRDYNQAAASLPAATEQILVAGVALVISRHLLAEEGALLPSKEPEMTELVLTPFLGGDEAKRIAHS